jgi:hypothetical protein
MIISEGVRKRWNEELDRAKPLPIAERVLLCSETGNCLWRFPRGMLSNGKPCNALRCKSLSVVASKRK